MTKNLNLTGVGGWLGFLIIGLMILGPVLGFGRLSNEFNDALEQFPQLINNAQWQNYKQISWLVFTVSASISFAAGYRLWKIHQPDSVNFAIVGIWIAGPLSNVLYIISVIVIFGDTAGSVISQMIGGTVSSVIIAGIWTAYLMRSLRVKNTYKLPYST